MPVERAGPEQIEALSALIDRWGQAQLAEGGAIAAVDRDEHELRWYVRMMGEEKSVTTAWLTLRERTLHVESYFMPAPEENVAACHEYLLRLNHRLFGVHFAIGLEDAVYLVGHVPVSSLDEAELDRVVGSVYAYSEQHFRPAMRIGYESKFRG